MKPKSLLTVPNILGFYRLIVFPLILWFALSGRQGPFAVFLIINLFTDIADGYIARRFKMETEFGARLDSLADISTYLLAFTGIYIFKLDDLLPHIESFIAFAAAMTMTVIVSLFRFGRVPSFHLYSTKAGGYIQGAFFIILFTFGFIPHLYYLMVIWGILSAVEHIAIQMIITEMRSNVKGLYWVLKNRNSPDRS